MSLQLMYGGGGGGGGHNCEQQLSRYVKQHIGRKC